MELLPLEEQLYLLVGTECVRFSYSLCMKMNIVMNRLYERGDTMSSSYR